MTKGSIRFIVFGGIGLVLLGTLIAIFAGRQNNSSPTDQPKAGIAITIVPAVEKPTRSNAAVSQGSAISTGGEGQIEADARQICGDRLVEVTVGATTTVTCKLTGNVPQDKLVDEVVVDLQGLTKAVMQHQDVQILRLEVIGQVKDKNGKLSEGVAFGFSIPKGLYKRVSQKNVSQRDFAEIISNGTDGSNAAIHPSLRDAWQAYMPD